MRQIHRASDELFVDSKGRRSGFRATALTIEIFHNEARVGPCGEMVPDQNEYSIPGVSATAKPGLPRPMKLSRFSSRPREIWFGNV